jgi:hypothetical protein
LDVSNQCNWKRSTFIAPGTCPLLYSEKDRASIIMV